MISYPMRGVTMVRGEWGEVGAQFTITDPPMYEVDPKTRKCRDVLQVFEITENSGSVVPVPVR